MSCLPGTPCYDELNPPALPEGVSSSDFIGYPIISSFIYYAGQNLPNTGIVTNDFLTVALQKIDPQLSAVSIAEKILNRMQTNTAYNDQICEAVQLCLGLITTTTTSTSTSSTTSTSTTSTSTSTSTTTTTTTAAPTTTTTTTVAPTTSTTSTTSTTTTAAPLNVLTYFGPTPGNACEENYYTVNVTLNVGATNLCTATIIYADYATYGLFNAIIYVKQSGTTVYRKFQIDPTGSFATPLELCEACSSITTTSTTSTTTTATPTTTTTTTETPTTTTTTTLEPTTTTTTTTDPLVTTTTTTTDPAATTTTTTSSTSTTSTSTSTTSTTSTTTSTSTSTTTTTTTQAPFSAIVSYGDSSYTACNTPIGTVTVVGNTPDFCTCTTFNSSGFTVFANGTYVLSYGGNEISVSITGAPTTVATVISASCTVCPEITTSTTTSTSTSTSTTTSTSTSTTSTTTSTTSTTSTTTTLPPVTLNVAPGCTGGEGTGTVLADSFGGGTESFEYISISSTSAADALSRLDNSATRTFIGGSTEYAFTLLPNATYYVAIMDYSGNKGASTGALVNCITTTTTSTTSTTSTTTSTTTTLPPFRFYRVDRRATCNTGVENPIVADVQLPYSFTPVLDNWYRDSSGVCTFSYRISDITPITPAFTPIPVEPVSYANSTLACGPNCIPTTTTTTSTSTTTTTTTLPCQCYTVLNEGSTTANYTVTNCDGTVQSPNLTVGSSFQHCVKGGTVITENSGILGVYDCGATCTIASNCSYCGPGPSNVTISPQNSLSTSSYTVYINGTADTGWKTGTRSYPAYTRIKIIYAAPACGVKLGAANYDSDTTLILVNANAYTFTLYNANNYVNNGAPYCSGNELRQPTINDCGATSYTLISSCSCSCNQACAGTYLGAEYCSGNQRLQDEFYTCNNVLKQTNTISTCSCTCNVACGGTYWGSNYCDGNALKRKQYYVCNNAETGTIETISSCSCSCNAACGGEYPGAEYCNPNGAGQVLRDIYYNCNNAYVRTEVVNNCSCSCNVGCAGIDYSDYCYPGDTTLYRRPYYVCNPSVWAGPETVYQVNSPTCGYTALFDLYQEQCGFSFAYYYVNSVSGNTPTATINGECCGVVINNVTEAFINSNYPSAVFAPFISNDNCTC